MLKNMHKPIELIDFSNTVEIIGRMNKKYPTRRQMQPIRKPQPPLLIDHQDSSAMKVNNFPNMNGQRSTNNLAQNNKSYQNAKSYYDLLEIARQQQQQIASNVFNVNSIEENQQIRSGNYKYNNSNGPNPYVSHGTSPVAEKLGLIRQKIAHNEKELAKLSSMQTETRNLIHKNGVLKRDIKNIENANAQEEYSLRGAINKVDFLKNQLDLLYRRRACAANAAIVQQRNVNKFHEPNMLQLNTASKSNYASGNLQQNIQQKLHKDINNSKRPQASVGPFQVIKRKTVGDELKKSAQKIHGQTERFPRIYGRFHRLSRDQCLGVQCITERWNIVLHNRISEVNKPLTSTHGMFDDVKGNYNIPSNYSNHMNRNNYAYQIPPTDKLSTLSSSKSTSYPVNNNFFKKSTYTQLENSPDKLSTENNGIKSNGTSLSNKMFTDETRFRKGKADLISLRNDSLKAAKRRSWAQASDTSEHENILRILLEEQRKGKSHLTFTDILPAKSASKYPYNKYPTDKQELDIVSKLLPDENNKQSEYEKPKNFTDDDKSVQIPTSSKTVKVTIHPVIEPKDKKEFFTYTETTINTDPIIQKNHEKEDEDEESEKLIPESIVEVDKNEGQVNEVVDLKQRVSTPEESNDDEASTNEEFPEFVETDKDVKPKLTSILKTTGKENFQRHVVFDPFVLFLDGALEGQLDTVKENASKIDDISMPNDEGITALHNAICACHYEIVKFLIDSHANDSDGWTPLHCAASCNNLVMVKMLVEAGACIYSTTLSDAEIPSKKCEENEDGYTNCANYLDMADKWAGIINDKKVYTIYSYDAKEEDELTFGEGDTLIVLNRDSNEINWWKCEHTKSGKQGMVPINYLSLYPTWKYVQQNGFVQFEIPNELSNENEDENDDTQTVDEHIKL